MKNLTINICLLLGLMFCVAETGYAQTRGASPGELYISTDWYMDNYGQIHYAILHSTDNGKTISLKYENIETPLPGEMTVGSVVGDATPGVLYNYGRNDLWVSFDYGVNWEQVDDFGATPNYTSGNIEGEIYKCCANVQGTVWRSIDFGNTFEEIRNDIKYKLEVGINNGVVYGLTNYLYPQIGFYLNYSSDYALNFVQIPIDSTVAFWTVSGHYPKISRGTQPGELFLAAWWLAPNYKIFHSLDNGYTWKEHFESDYINFYNWRVSFTAGREPGSYYVIRSRLNPALDHVWLYIDYSSDYGKTFTTYFHDLDLTVGTSNFEWDNIQLSNYPNPFTGHTTISFDIPGSAKNPVLNIYDFHGTIIRQYRVAGKKSQPWDGTDSNGNKVSNGVYFYNIHSENCVSPFNKLLIID